MQCEYISHWLKKHPLKRSVKVRQSDRITRPLTYGILAPVILLPRDTEWKNEERLQHILSHEYIHIRHFDMAVKLIAAAALCIHWFNPLVWMMYILFNRDMELACDESVVKQFGSGARAAYARTLIAMGEKESGLNPLCSNFSKNAVEERITAIMKTKKLTAGVLLVSAAVLIVIVVLFATSGKTEEDPMVYVMGRLFVSTQQDISETVYREMENSVYDFPYIGVIESTVDSGQIPDQELQSNFGCIGAEIVFSGSGIAVDIDGSWIYFAPQGSNEMGESGDAEPEATNPSSRQESEEEKEILAYVEGCEGKVIAFDEVEWITFPSQRAAELGITDPGGGFLVLNEEVLIQELLTAEDCTYSVLDWTAGYSPTEITGEELSSLLKEREGLLVPYRLTIKGDRIIRIAEQYVP